MSRSARSIPRSRRWGSPGISMVEATISIVIVGTMVVAGLSAVGASARVQQRMTDSGRGFMLAQQLMSEIMQQSYEEPVDTRAFGRELTEGAASRANYDDVDDYYDWSASPPENKDGTAISGLDDWSRSVVVEWVSAGDLSLVSGSDTGVKRITVTVEHNDVPAAQLVAVRTGAAQLLFEIDAQRLQPD